eukprot:CAMPEP_0174256252 /NCGR_PEP_ID=MMETSP0439-20130205/5507_1 /TAXON_ID=0 /ORGANISM="Stereomyxa ramosa, Strain Chinc5" /LENGTH=67 /DNA_ID=CAMNT_0015338779 /DNA_START=28 /DNA_END=231 /DNA_ORIENTATION=-
MNATPSPSFPTSFFAQQLRRPISPNNNRNIFDEGSLRADFNFGDQMGLNMYGSNFAGEKRSFCDYVS